MSDGRKGLVLDANILLRAVFGQRLRQILEAFEDEARFYWPDVCFADTERYIPDISKRRHLDADLALSLLGQIEDIVERVDRSLYEEYESTARGPLSTGLIANQRGIAKGAACRVMGLVRREATVSLFFLFQFKIGQQLSLQIRIPFSELPPSHFSSPQQRATSLGQQPRSSFSTATLPSEAVSYPFLSDGST